MDANCAAHVWQSKLAHVCGGIQRGANWQLKNCNVFCCWLQTRSQLRKMWTNCFLMYQIVCLASAIGSIFAIAKILNLLPIIWVGWGGGTILWIGVHLVRLNMCNTRCVMGKCNANVQCLCSHCATFVHAILIVIVSDTVWIWLVLLGQKMLAVFCNWRCIWRKSKNMRRNHLLDANMFYNSVGCQKRAWLRLWFDFPKPMC